jgi:guanylate kinase
MQFQSVRQRTRATPRSAYLVIEFVRPYRIRFFSTFRGEYMLTPGNQKSKKRLSKRSRTMNHHMKMKASIQYVPSDDDISQMLKEFTVDFLLNGIVNNCYLANIWTN